MGAWGPEPWENDAASAWFAGLFEHLKLQRQIRSTLGKDVAAYPDQVRAAAWLLLQLGRPHVWPEEDLDRDLELGAQQLRALLADPDWQELYGSDDDVVAAVEAELTELEARLER